MISHLPDALSQLAAIFLSIIIEALPFVLFGCLISGIIETYLSPELIQQDFYRKAVSGVLSLASWQASFSILRVRDCAHRQSLPRKESTNLYRYTLSHRSAHVRAPVILLATFIAFGNSFKFALLRLSSI